MTAVPTSDVYVLIKPEVATLLADNGVALTDLLAREGQAVPATTGSDPSSGADGTKDVLLVLLGVSALVTSLTPVIIRAINRLTRRPVLVREMVLVAVEDSEGRTVPGADGQPILHWVERARFVTPDDGQVAERLHGSVKALGVEIALESSVDD
ncbi:hypothetical protein AB0K00_49260 [Dactylosporangium sp. NPDC049525]|uniref:hypothetical protein n=1 Tax=Dactylosporangium sp. NPDC049525 TaxID=3154730 RepID=UPI003436C6FB